MIQNKLQKLNNKKITVTFIGYKAGLLEALSEINSLMKNNKDRIKLICISPSLESLKKANLTSLIKKPKLYFQKKRFLYSIIFKDG